MAPLWINFHQRSYGLIFLFVFGRIFVTGPTFTIFLVLNLFTNVIYAMKTSVLHSNLEDFLHSATWTVREKLITEKHKNWLKKNRQTFLSAPVNDMLEIFLDRFSGAFSSSMIPVACSIHMLDLHSSHNVFNSLIIAC